MSEHMIYFSLRNRGQGAMKSIYIRFSDNLSCSMNPSVVLGRFEVILDSFPMSSGNVSGAPEIYSWSSLIDKILSSSSSATPKSVSPFRAVQYVRSGSSEIYFLFLIVLRSVTGSGMQLLQ